MNREMMILVLITTLFFASCTAMPENNAELSSGDMTSDSMISRISVGMTYDDILWTKDQPQFRLFFNYLFCKDSDGRNMVAEFGKESETIDKIEVFPGTQPDSVAFSAIQKGMNIFDVVERVGAPINSATFGLKTLDFESIDGDIYRIQFDTQMKVIEVTKQEK